VLSNAILVPKIYSVDLYRFLMELPPNDAGFCIKLVQCCLIVMQKPQAGAFAIKHHLK
jgi:hypothetical protein